MSKRNIDTLLLCIITFFNIVVSIMSVYSFKQYIYPKCNIAKMLFFIFGTIVVTILCIQMKKQDFQHMKLHLYVRLTTLCLFWITIIITIYATEVVDVVERGTVEYYQRLVPLLVQFIPVFICELYTFYRRT